MMLHSNYQWLRGALQTSGSIFPKVFPRVLVCGILGVMVAALHHRGMMIGKPGIITVVPSLVLGLLLVFRTNTAYERFWEGRKLWGGIINTTRNLSRKIWVFVKEKTPADHFQKAQILHLLVALAIATKQHLRQEPFGEDLVGLVSDEQYQKLKLMNHPPLELAFWINDYLNLQHEKGNLSTYEMIAIVQLLNNLVDYIGSCERIIKTPIPLAYSIHLKQLLLLYCLILPFELVANFGWFTGIIAALASFTLLGIEEIGIEIENPFGRDPNDLPLDTICQTMRRNIEDLMTLSPSSRQWRDIAFDLPSVSDLLRGEDRMEEENQGYIPDRSPSP